MMENNELRALSEEDFLHMLYALGYIATDADLEKAMQEAARTVPASNPPKPMNVKRNSNNVNDI